MKNLRRLSACFILLPLLFLVACATTPKLITESFYVPAKDPGIELYVRNKHPENVTKFGPEKILLFLHGAGYCSESVFDLALNGQSWMDFIAQRGWDVYLMDLRGYGRSTHPSEMRRPPAENPPLVNTDVAVRDVEAVVDHILARRGVERISLLGWSWGTAIMGAYTSQNNAKVERLVLYGPLWLFKGAQPFGALGAYRNVTREMAEKTLRRGVAPERQKEFLPAEWFNVFWEEAVGADPTGAGKNPPIVSIPNGALEDVQKYWMAGKPHYEPAKITVPTLVIESDWNTDLPSYMAPEIFANLKNAPVKRMVTLGQATHWVMIEKNRLQLFREVQLFLEEPK